VSGFEILRTTGGTVLGWMDDLRGNDHKSGTYNAEYLQKEPQVYVISLLKKVHTDFIF
jgi:hypothetical protein